MAKKYQNPIILFDSTDSERYQIFCIRLNLFANKVLPAKVLHYINQSIPIRKWQYSEKKRQSIRKRGV